MVRRLFLVFLWVITTLLCLFCMISFASVLIRLQAAASLLISIAVTVFRNSKRSLLWWLGCCLGIAVALSAVYPLADEKGTTASSSGFADTSPYLSTTVATAYGENKPTIRIVDPRYDANPNQTTTYIITLLGSFTKGNLRATTLEYRISADQQRIWDIRGLDDSNHVLWTDSQLP